MKSMCVRDLMIPLMEYALVPRDATVLDAIRTLKEARDKLKSGQQSPRAVLVVDAAGKVVGQLGHLDILRALEPGYNQLGDLSMLSRAGVSNDTINSIVDNLRFWEGDLVDACRRAGTINVTEIMRPVTESIDVDAPLSEAIHKIVMWQTMRMLVTDGKEVVGILRLADLVAEVTRCIDEFED